MLPVREWWPTTRNFLRDVWVEMKKVSWPGRNEVVGTTLVVIVGVVFVALYLGLVALVSEFGIGSAIVTLRDLSDDAIAVMVNYLGFEHYRRWDLSRDQKFALSDKTKRFLQSMPGKARITVFFMPNNAIASDVQGMLTEYQYAAKGKLDVENIDPERNLSRAKALLDKYKVVTGEDLLILDYDGRNKTVKASEMAEIDQGNSMFGEPPKVTAYKGEQAVTSALMELVEGKKNTIGYVLGHKEPPIAEPSPAAIPRSGPSSRRKRRSPAGRSGPLPRGPRSRSVPSRASIRH